MSPQGNAAVHAADTDDAPRDDPWRMRTECLALARERGATLRAAVRFLQVVDRRVAHFGAQGLEFVDELRVGRDHWVASHDTRELEVGAPLLEIEPGAERVAPIHAPEGIEAKWIEDASGRRVGAIVRRWVALEGELRLRCERVSEGTFRIGVEVVIAAPSRGAELEESLRRSLASVQVVLEASRAELSHWTGASERTTAHAAQLLEQGTSHAPLRLAMAPARRAPFDRARARRGVIEAPPDPIWREVEPVDERGTQTARGESREHERAG